MVSFNLSSMSLNIMKDNTSDTVFLSAKYNGHSTAEVQIRGEDELYALKFLVDRAVAKVEGGKP